MVRGGPARPVEISGLLTKSAGRSNPYSIFRQFLPANSRDGDLPLRNESDRNRVIRNGRAALKRLQNDRNWTDWLAVGEAILIGREDCKEACGLKDTNLPPAIGVAPIAGCSANGWRRKNSISIKATAR